MPDAQPNQIASSGASFSAPKSDAEIINWIRLIRSRRVGPTTFLRLIKEYRDVEAALSALPEIARNAGVKTYTPFPLIEAEREFQCGLKAGARPVCLGSGLYPPLLARISDPPPVLWCIGNPKLMTRPNVAVVGARNASSLGSRMARLLSGELANLGFSVTSGLARGIDTSAHLAALDGGTIAVMAGGVDYFYPRENTKLAEDIAQSGLLISEQPCGLIPQARHFPTRNRIIAGLSQGVVVVEGAARSGSLITASAALDQGREVMAVPGHPLDGRAVGCNMLIKDGAALVRSGKDVAVVLENAPQNAGDCEAKEPTATAPVQTAVPSGAPADIGTRILNLLGPSPIPEDQLIRELALPSQTVSPHLLDLELKGKLNRQSGGMLALAV